MQKVSITSDASLWAELAKRRHENFCSPFLRVASVESTRIYEKLVAKKVKDTPLMINIVEEQTLLQPNNNQTSGYTMERLVQKTKQERDKPII